MDNKNTITTNENIEIYENDIYILCDEFINGLHDPNDIYNNKRLVSDLLRYLYNNKVCYILNNNHKNGNRYNIFILDKLFYICCDIVHRYNSNMNILLFCCFCNLSRSIINDWKNNINRELTPDESVIVQKWYQISELDLIQGSSVFDIFMLKSNFNYNDNIQSRPDENIKSISADQLPLLGENTDIM